MSKPDELDELTAWDRGLAQAKRLYDESRNLDRSTILQSQKKKAQGWVRTNPFILGCGLKASTGQRRVFWLSNGEDPALFAEYGLVGPWTPVGRLVLRAKDTAKDGKRWSGRRPSHADWVKVPGGFTWSPDGPIVDFRFSAGVTAADLLDAVVWAPDGPLALSKSQPKPGKGQTAQVTAGARAGFGLGDVVGSLDGFQLDNIDFDADGPLVITGAAGTGKTTVAFYRAAYLLEEQRTALKEDSSGTVHFRVDQMLVLVRREHLKPYLAGLSKEVGVSGFPVKTFDEWFQAEVFRPYLRKEEVKFATDAPADLEGFAALFHERDIESFIELRLRERISEECANLKAAASRCEASIRGLKVPASVTPGRRETIDLLREGWIRSLGSISRPSGFRIREIREHFDRALVSLRRIRESLAKDSDLSMWLKEAGPKVAGLIGDVESERQRLPSRLYSFDKLTKDFYGSAQALAALRRAFGARAVPAQAALADPKRPFSRADDVVVGWLIELLTEGVTETAPHLSPLPRYDHLILDEAQFYAPAMVRLLKRLTKAPRRALTVAGDLEQRSSQSGLTDWRDLVGDGEHHRVRKLNRIYRASREIYAFLVDLNTRLGLQSTLQAPRDFDQFSGELPKLLRCDSVSEEMQTISAEVERIKAERPDASVAVIVRDGQSSAGAAEALKGELNANGVPARIAYGEQIGERLDKVLITDADSVVGLEFDAVVLVGVERLWPSDLSPEDTRAFWICATRAKRYLTITATERWPDWLGQDPLGGVVPVRPSV